MSLNDWLNAGWLQRHLTSPEEIRDLWLIADRDLRDAGSPGISLDWQYGIAYNAALKLCTLLLAAEGFRPGKGAQAHVRVIHALPLILGGERQGDANYLEGCRQKRHRAEYDHIGVVSSLEVGELLDYVAALRPAVAAWLQEKHPELSPAQ